MDCQFYQDLEPYSGFSVAQDISNLVKSDETRTLYSHIPVKYQKERGLFQRKHRHLHYQCDLLQHKQGFPHGEIYFEGAAIFLND